MALADVVKKEHSTLPSIFSVLFPLETHSMTHLLRLAVIGPILLLLTTVAAYGVKGLPYVSCTIALLSMVLLLKWRSKGFLGALSLIACSYFGRVLFDTEMRVVWELGFFFATGIGIFISHQCFEECIETYERESLSVTEDFEQLKQVHVTYTKEKAEECERLKSDLQQYDVAIGDCKEEITSLKNVVLSSSAQAASFAQKNKQLQEKIFELHKSMVELKAKKFPPDINPKMLKELNTLRVDNFQQKKLVEQVLSIVHPLRVDSLVEAIPETVSKTNNGTVQEEKKEVSLPQKTEELSEDKTLLSEKEKEKARSKKTYYEQLDICNSLKAAYSKDLSNTEAKREYDNAAAILKEKKADLVAIEKELFSLKKELRDKGQLFS